MSSQTVQGSIDINAPIDLVWNVICCDLETHVESIDWCYEAWREDNGPMRLGSVYVERAKPGKEEGTYRWEITAFEPPYRIVHSHASKQMEADLEILCKPIDENSTLCTQVNTFRILPYFRTLGFILERTVVKRKMLHNLKQMILPNYKRITEQRYMP